MCADRETLQQIVLNLLSNSAKFAEERGNVTGLCDVRGKSVYISVRDTGVGIAAEKLQSVFEPFVRVERKLSQPATVAGLGLAMLRDLARSVGGDLAAESSKAGSTFTLIVPCVQNHDPSEIRSMTINRAAADSVLTPDVDVTPEAGPVDPSAAKPDLSKTGSAVESLRARASNLTVLTVLAVLYTLYFAREFLLPIVFALLLSFLLSPVVRVLARFRIPIPLGAGIIILAILGLLGSGAFGLSGSVREWAATAPQTLGTAETRLDKIIRPIQRASRTAEQVASGVNTAAGNAGATKPREVVVQGPSLASRAFGTTQRSVASVLEVLILLYFLLAAGDLFLEKLIKVLPNLGEKKKAVQIARETESSISTYLLTASLVNIGEGLVVTGVMYLWGMPNPPLWGALVALFEFIPYLGALAMVVILSVAALTTFDNIGHALLVPASYLLINLIQGNLVSPLLLGHRLSLNPVALFVGLAFWFWIWGIAGAFIAVPLMATFKIFCDHIESLTAFGEFLGQRDERERRPTIRLP